MLRSLKTSKVTINQIHNLNSLSKMRSARFSGFLPIQWS